MIKPKCPHHWKLPPGGGEYVTGRCANCGATREFQNQLTEEQRRKLENKPATRSWGWVA